MAEALRTQRDPDVGLGQLLGRTGRDLADLMRCEVELARLELVDEAKQAGRASALLVVGGVFGAFALLLALFAAAWGLDEVMPTGFAFLIVAIVTAVVAAVLISVGRKRLARIETVPRNTAATLKEDAEWARQQMR